MPKEKPEPVKASEITEENAALPVGPFIFKVSRLRQLEEQAAAVDFAPDASGAAASKAQRRQAAAALSQRTSKYKGVNLHSRSCRWDAHFWDKRQVHLGCFDFEIQAAVAYDMAALKVKGPDAQLNFHVSNYTEEMQQLHSMTFPEVVASLRSSRRHLLTNLRLNVPGGASTTYIPPPPPPYPSSRAKHSTEAAPESTSMQLPHKVAAKRARTDGKRPPPVSPSDSHLSNETRHRAVPHDAPLPHPSAAPHPHAPYSGLTIIQAGHLPPGYHIAAHPPTHPAPPHQRLPAAAPAPPNAPPGTSPVFICYTPSNYGTPSQPVIEYVGLPHPHTTPHTGSYYAPAGMQFLTADPCDAPPSSRPIAIPAAHLITHPTLAVYPPPTSSPARPAARHPSISRHSDASPPPSPRTSPAKPTLRPRAAPSPDSSPSHPSPPRPTSPSATSEDEGRSLDGTGSIYTASHSLLLRAGRIRAKRLRDQDAPVEFQPPPAAAPHSKPHARSHPATPPMAAYPPPAAAAAAARPPPHTSHFIAIDAGNGHYYLAPSHDLPPIAARPPAAALIPQAWDDHTSLPYPPSATTLTVPGAYPPGHLLAPAAIDPRHAPPSAVQHGRPQIVFYDPHMHPPHP